ncbi:MAG: 5-deoxy-glucuronate isomerase [Sphaerochaeta sp.]|nr:5-deoxy-glucuronate isomerase [Sphaerochaeta sp.]
MIVKHEKKFNNGYNPITALKGKHKEMLLDFGILAMDKGDTYTCELPLERAYLLIFGEVTFITEGVNHLAKRESFLDEAPQVLHVSRTRQVTIQAHKKTQICVERCENKTDFPSKVYTPDNVKSDIFGAGVLNEASNRTVRTVFDGEIAPYSNMVLGEVINHPGKWSSYPPHDHPHPEIYHYRLFPSQGFGVSLLDEDAHVVKDCDTSLIPPNVTHSQVAGAGYAMYYIWMIPHLPEEKWLPTTRYYRKEHTWLLDKDVKIWPERKYKGE